MKAIQINKGDRFGRLTVVEEQPDGSRDRKFFVECDCGTGLVVRLASMRRGKTKSCGCLQRENRMTVNKTHGHNTRTNRSKTYDCWAAMTQRCTNPNRSDYSRYGGRGIGVCKRWLTFVNFLEDMGEKPEGLTIERINNAKGYTPDNCKWATVSEQNRNRRNVRQIIFNGKTQSLAEWAREVGIDRETLLSRIKRGVELPDLFDKKHGNTH